MACSAPAAVQARIRSGTGASVVAPQSPRAARDTSAESSTRAAGRFAAPEGDAGAAPWASSTRTRPGFDAADAPGSGAQQEDVAGHALDGEIFIHGADRGAFRLGHHQVVRVIGDGAAGSDGGEARAAPAAHDAVDGDRGAGTRRCGRARWRCLRRASRALRRNRARSSVR